MTIKRRGPIAKTIDDLCVRLCLGNGNEAEFKESLKEILHQWGASGMSLLNIGMAFQRSATEYCRDKVGYLWGLVDEVEPKIRKAWEQYETTFLGITPREAPSSSAFSGDKVNTGGQTVPGIVACWHHADEERLRKHLRCSRIDLYGPTQLTSKGTNRLNHWWNKMCLKRKDRVRIVVRGHVVAFATIDSGPYDLPVNEVCREWGSAVDLRDIDEQVAPFRVASCAHLQRSHRFDGPKTSLLVR